jgi:hypothetical protein
LCNRIYTGDLVQHTQTKVNYSRKYTRSISW